MLTIYNAGVTTIINSHLPYDIKLFCATVELIRCLKKFNEPVQPNILKLISFHS